MCSSSVDFFSFSPFLVLCISTHLTHCILCILHTRSGQVLVTHTHPPLEIQAQDGFGGQSKQLSLRCINFSNTEQPKSVCSCDFTACSCTGLCLQTERNTPTSEHIPADTWGKGGGAFWNMVGNMVGVAHEEWHMSLIRGGGVVLAGAEKRRLAIAVVKNA